MISTYGTWEFYIFSFYIFNVTGVPFFDAIYIYIYIHLWIFISIPNKHEVYITSIKPMKLKRYDFIFQENEQDRGVYTDAAKMRILGSSVYTSLSGPGEVGNRSNSGRTFATRCSTTTTKPRPSHGICFVAVPEW